MASILSELDAIVAHITPLHEGATYVQQNIPEEPTPNTFSVRFLRDSRSMETNLRMKIQREYQIVYFGTDIADVLTRMEAVSRKALNDNMMIPLQDGSLRYIRVESFSLSAPLTTESEVDAMIGILVGEVRECRTQEAFEKIKHMYLRVQARE